VQANPKSGVQHLVEKHLGKHCVSGAIAASCPVVEHDSPQYPFVGYCIVRTGVAATALGAEVGCKVPAGMVIEAGWDARTVTVPAIEPLQLEQIHQDCSSGHYCIVAAELADSALAVLAGQSNYSVPSSQTLLCHNWAVKMAIVVEWYMYSVAAGAAAVQAAGWDVAPDSGTVAGVLAVGAADSFGSSGDAVVYYVPACFPTLS
jgi:hypothetical protein